MEAIVLESSPRASALRWHWLRRLAAVGCLVVVGLVLPLIKFEPMRVILVGMVISAFLLFLLMDFWASLRGWQVDRSLKILQDMLSEDATPCFATDIRGLITFRNAAAEGRNPHSTHTMLADTLSDYFAEPEVVMFRLINRTGLTGAAREDVVTRRGVLRLSVHRISEQHYLWRYEELGERGPLARSADGVSMPMLVATGEGDVLFANRALIDFLGARPRSLEWLFGNQEIRSGQTVSVQRANAPAQAVVIEITVAAERREIYLLPLAELPGFGAGEEGFEDLPLALVHFDEMGRVLLANAAAREHLGVLPDEAVNASDLFEGLGRPVRDWIADVAFGRHSGKTEMLQLSRQPEENFVQLWLRPMPHALGKGVLGVVQDVTELKALEAKFAQSQKMQAIGQLAGGIAHDFNNLLTAISGHCDLLMLNHDEEDIDYPDLAQIRQNTNRASGLVGQLLAFSRKQTMQSRAVNVNDVLADVTSLLKRLVPERIQLQLSLEEGLGLIRIDPRQLEQVLVNLVVNARDAMVSGGLVRILTESHRFSSDHLQDNVTLSKGDYIRIRIEDTGTGIPPDTLGKIFEPFFTTKRQGEGTGLGLSMVYGIVKQSSGYIFVDSQLGQGTTFTLYFPLHTPPQNEVVRTVAPDVPARTTAPLSRQGVILLVEDEAPVRAFAARALKLRGHTVLEADCGESALDVLRDTELSVDIVVTDVIMPGLDGPAWVRIARESCPDVAVVFMSGYAEDGFVGAQQDIGNSIFLPKPFSLEELTRTVHQQLVAQGLG